MNTQHHYAVIMAGGIGSRFWPISRSSYPKQFLDILNTGRTLLQATFDRFLQFIPTEHIYIVTAEEYLPLVQEQLPELPTQNIIGEPERKNTAPCIAYISQHIYQQDAQANIIVAPSDHVIRDEGMFIGACITGLAYTNLHPTLVTLGITPTHPNTGYGYIRAAAQQLSSGVYAVEQFVEKPDLPTAQAYLASGAYCWNAGIFIWKAADILTALARYQPTLYEQLQVAAAQMGTGEEAAGLRRFFADAAPISIDNAILELSDSVAVIPASFGWSDLGTWNSAWEHFEKDGRQNALAGNNTLAIDSNGCMVHSTDGKLVVLGGVDDLIIVNTEDALLICPKSQEQQIKEYINRVKEQKGAVYL